jgi:hypothetical protein
MPAALQSFFSYLALAAALVNLSRRKWSLNLLALGIQSLCLFPALTSILSIELALIQPFTGLMVTLILYITLISVGGIEPLKLKFKLSSGEVFRGLAGLLLIAMLRAFMPVFQPAVFPQVPSQHLFLSLGLVLLGSLQLGTIREPFYLAMGLLTFLAGFELLYSALEFSFLLEAFLVTVNLSLAIVGAYFIIKNAESSPE